MHNNSMAAANARYGRIIMGAYTLINVLLLVSVVATAWIFTVRAHHHEISPNTTLGFRSQATLASLHGWYVAQRVGFQFVAIAATAVTVAVLLTMAIAYLRGPKPLWIFAAPAIGAAVIALSFMVAGERADAAATHVETPATPSPSTSQ